MKEINAAALFSALDSARQPARETGDPQTVRLSDYAEKDTDAPTARDLYAAVLRLRSALSEANRAFCALSVLFDDYRATLDDPAPLDDFDDYLTAAADGIDRAIDMTDAAHSEIEDVLLATRKSGN